MPPDERSEVRHNDASWKHTFDNAKNLLRMFPDYLPNTYMQYYLLGDQIVKDSDKNHTRANEVMEGREIRNLPDDAMVEIPCYITSEGPEPTRVGEIPTFFKGMIEQQEACEKLIVEAAVEGSYEKALMAFTLNKTIPSAAVAKQILDEMIEANKEYWPELK